jgi:hypothetical protein
MGDWLLFAGTVVTAISSVIAVYMSNKKANIEMLQHMEVNDAVRDEKIEELTREVRRHNNFAERMPEIEGDIKVINEQIKVVNHRLSNLENRN